MARGAKKNDLSLSDHTLTNELVDGNIPCTFRLEMAKSSGTSTVALR